jgi:hypothetical protein
MIIYDRGFGRIWHDGVTSCVFSNLVAIPSEVKLNEFLDLELALIREVKQHSGFVLAICDMQFLSHIPKDLAALYADRVREQFRAGLFHKSFIKPSHKLINQMLLGTPGATEHFSVSVHQTLKEAIADLHIKTVKSNYGIASSVFNFLKHL